MRGSNKIQLNEILSLLISAGIKKKTATTQSSTRIFVSYILTDWKKIVQKKILRQEMWQKTSYIYAITSPVYSVYNCITHCHHVSSQKNTIILTKAVIHIVFHPSVYVCVCVFPQAFQSLFKELWSSQCQNSIYQIQYILRERNIKARSI